MESGASGGVTLPPVLDADEPVADDGLPFAPGLIMNGAAAALALFTMWQASAPHWEGGIFAWGVSVVGWIGLASYWLLALAIVLFTERRLQLLVQWACAPALAVVTLLAVVTSAPLVVRFHASRGAMDALAAKVVSKPGQTQFSDRRVGLFHAADIARIPGGMRFTTGDGLFDAHGFAYSAHGSLASTPVNTYEHLSGHWYIWEGRSD